MFTSSHPWCWVWSGVVLCCTCAHAHQWCHDALAPIGVHLYVTAARCQVNPLEVRKHNILRWRLYSKATWYCTMQCLFNGVFVWYSQLDLGNMMMHQHIFSAMSVVFDKISMLIPNKMILTVHKFKKSHQFTPFSEEKFILWKAEKPISLPEPTSEGLNACMCICKACCSLEHGCKS